MSEYPWWTRLWPIGRVYFAGWLAGHESGTQRGRFQMGDGYNLLSSAEDNASRGFKCLRCNGTGHVVVHDLPDGSGRVARCWDCDGTGRASDDEQ